MFLLRAALLVVAALVASLAVMAAFDVNLGGLRALPSFEVRNVFGERGVVQVALGTLKLHAPFASAAAKTRKRISNSQAVLGNATPTSFAVKMIAIYLAASNNTADKMKLGETCKNILFYFLLLASV